jgi:hypothetical protein
MDWPKVAGVGGTWLLCIGMAWLIWGPFEQKWPRAAVGFFSAGMVLGFDTGLGHWIRSIIEWVIDKISWLLSLVHVHGHSVIVIASATIVSLATLIALGYLIAHLVPNKWVTTGASESTFIAAFVVIALASIIPGPVGGWISSALGGIADVISYPLHAAFKA